MRDKAARDTTMAILASCERLEAKVDTEIASLKTELGKVKRESASSRKVAADALSQVALLKAALAGEHGE